MAEPAVDEFSELVDADIERVDLVGKGANGIPFLIAKSALLPADAVSELIKQAEPTPTPEHQEHMVTVSGSPAAIAEMIAKAPVRKKDFDTAERKHDAATGAAMPDGSYPIENKSQLSDAIHAVGRGSGSHDAIRRHIISRAKSLGASSEIPDNWNSDGSIKKAAGDGMDDAPVEADDLIPDDASAGSTAETMPGSPDWEQLDADTAAGLVGVLGRVKCALEWLCERESTEAVTVDPDDADNAFDLQDAICQVECLIRCLAGFAAGEQLEASLPDEMEAVGKAAADVADPLATLEVFQAVTKAGRVLSSQNEQRVKQASALLSEVLASLPAPVLPEAPAAPVEKSEEDTMTEQVEKAAEDDAAPVAEQNTEPASAEADVVKAKGDPQVAVYTADGKLVGVVDQTDISPIAAPSAPEGGDEQSAHDDSDSAPAAPADAEPAPAADATEEGTDGAAEIPGTDTVQAPAEPTDDSDDEDVAKTSEIVKAAVAESTAELAAELQLLKEQLAAYGQLPAPSGVRLNGATGTAGLAPRSPESADEVEELRKAAEAETDPKKREELSYGAALAAIRKAQSGRGPYVGSAPVNAAEVLARFTN